MRCERLEPNSKTGEKVYDSQLRYQLRKVARALARLPLPERDLKRKRHAAAVHRLQAWIPAKAEAPAPQFPETDPPADGAHPR